MKKIWIALAGVSLASVACSAAQATIFNFDIQYWDGFGEPPTDDTDPGDFAHFVVDDAWGGNDYHGNHPTGIWTYGNDGSYFGLPFQNAFIDVYNDYWGGGFTFTPYVVDDIGNDPDFDFVLDLYGPSALGGTSDAYHILPGVYDTDDGYGDYFRVTITEADAGPGAVPEPATWAMMVGGFGAVGAAMRRRQRTKVSFG
jgi:hypothetical protein